MVSKRNEEVAEPTNNLPMLMESVGGGHVILVTKLHGSIGTGTVVWIREGYTNQTVGEHSDAWCIGRFIPLKTNCSITLSND